MPTRMGVAMPEVQDGAGEVRPGHVVARFPRTLTLGPGHRNVGQGERLRGRQIAFLPGRPEWYDLLAHRFSPSRVRVLGLALGVFKRAGGVLLSYLWRSYFIRIHFGSVTRGWPPSTHFQTLP